MSKSLASCVEFKKFCEMLDSIYKSKGASKSEKLGGFLRECRLLGDRIKKQYNDADVSLFPILRLILPNHELERGPYGLKHKAIADLYVRVFCIGKSSDSANKLRNYRTPCGGENVGIDFAERVFWVFHKQLANNSSSLSIEDINSFLDTVAEKNASNQSKDQIFFTLVRKLSAEELKWLTRILLKDLKLGLAQKKIFEAIHPRAEELFNVTSRLRQVCERLEDPSIVPERSIQIEIFSHFKPMLLEKCKIENVGKLFADDNSYYIQVKHDGERSQLHMKDGAFKYFTRNGYDISKNSGYGESRNSGFLTKNISPLLNANCKSVILDGEIMGWHKVKKTFGTQGQSFDVKLLTEKSYYQPCFVAFDVVLYNDELLVDRPYSERLRILETVFTEQEGTLIRSKTTLLSRSDEVLRFFNEALDNNDEGIVLKKCNATYKPKVREGSGCYKIKAEYSDDLVKDLDLVILGGYYGEGRTSGVISSFLVGVANNQKTESGLPLDFSAVVAVRSGLSIENIKNINEKCKSQWKQNRPNNVHGPKSNQPDLWIAPKQSMILEIRATEVIRTHVYPLGYSMRFPRVLKVREDKPWHDACSVSEFMSLVKNKGPVQKMTKRHATADDIDSDVPPKASRGGQRSTTTSMKVDERFLGVHDFNVTRISRLFEGREFCVLHGDQELSKSEAEKMILEHMGKIVQNPKKETFCVLISDPKKLKAKNAIQCKKYDVASLDWLRRATKPENWSSLQDFYPWEMFSMRPPTKRRLAEVYDEYYDSYTDDADEVTLKRSLEKAEEAIEDDTEFTTADMKTLDEELFQNGVSTYSVFRGHTGFFHNNEDLSRYTFRFMSGSVAEKFDRSVNFVFIDDYAIKENLHQYKLEEGEEGPIILKSQWIEDCFKQQKLLDVDDFKINV